MYQNYSWIKLLFLKSHTMQVSCKQHLLLLQILSHVRDMKNILRGHLLHLPSDKQLLDSWKNSKMLSTLRIRSNKMYLPSQSLFSFHLVTLCSQVWTPWFGLKKVKNNSSQIDPKFSLDLQHTYHSGGKYIYIYIFAVKVCIFLKLSNVNEGLKINVLNLWFYLHVVGLWAPKSTYNSPKETGQMLTNGPFHNPTPFHPPPAKICSSSDEDTELGFTETQFYSYLSTMANNEIVRNVYYLIKYKSIRSRELVQ